MEMLKKFLQFDIIAKLLNLYIDTREYYGF